MHQQPPSEKKSKRSSKFLAFLTCCASSSNETEDTVPAKRTVRQTVPSSQPTPEKVDVNTGDSSTVEPKEVNHVEDEKQNAAVTPDKSQSPEEVSQPGPPEQGLQVDGTASSVGKHEPGHVDSQKGGAEIRDSDARQDALEATTAPEKADDTASAAPVAEDSAEQTDQGPEKTSLVEDRVEDDTKRVADEEAIKSPASLPPPPPLAPPETQEPSAPGDRSSMLLPPALPHLHGRKCLVLDLDETLVHSSFKVFLRPANSEER